MKKFICGAAFALAATIGTAEAFDGEYTIQSCTKDDYTFKNTFKVSGSGTLVTREQTQELLQELSDSIAKRFSSDIFENHGDDVRSYAIPALQNLEERLGADIKDVESYPLSPGCNI